MAATTDPDHGRARMQANCDCVFVFYLHTLTYDAKGLSKSIYSTTVPLRNEKCPWSITVDSTSGSTYYNEVHETNGRSNTYCEYTTRTVMYMFTGVPLCTQKLVQYRPCLITVSCGSTILYSENSSTIVRSVTHGDVRLYMSFGHYRILNI